MEKAEARKVFLAKRKALSATDFALLNADLLDLFTELPLEGVQRLHLFLPIQHHREVNTYFISDRLRAEHPEISLIISRSDFETGKMKHVLWTKNMPLELNAYGIPEPIDGEPVSSELIDMVLVPLVAFDKKGHRVGYGKGFYDRFLAECRHDCQKVGLSLFGPIDAIDDSTDSDVLLTHCVTPEAVYRF